MPGGKVKEITTSSPKSFEDAIRTGLTRVNRSLKQVSGTRVADQKLVIQNNRIVEYRVHLKVTFG